MLAWRLCDRGTRSAGENVSGIAGICCSDGRPVSRTAVREMLRCLAYRGPDGQEVWIQGPVGLGHCQLRTTPESLLERQPLLSEDGLLCLTADARVDNRDELARALARRA